MQAARIITPKEPLEIKQLETPKPRGSQVLVKVQSSGVCHSDIHLWDGGYMGLNGQFLKTTDRGVKYPLTPGHEIAGIITDMGEDAKEASIQQDQKVMVYPWVGDGLCPACRVGDENLCDKPRSLGVYRDGGYVEKNCIFGRNLSKFGILEFTSVQAVGFMISWFISIMFIRQGNRKNEVTSKCKRRI